ncbi:unnamed protein product, partial [Allacma fusca]
MLSEENDMPTDQKKKKIENERRKALRLNNKNIINQQQRETREVNRDEINEHRRVSRYENIESTNASQRFYRGENMPALNEQRCAYYCQNREVINEQRSKRRAENAILANDQQRSFRSAKRHRNVETHYRGLSKNFDESLINEHYCGSMDKVCHNCNALHFEMEGKRLGAKENASLSFLVTVKQLTLHPELISDLFKDKTFMKNVLSYNSYIAMASCGGKIDHIS